MLVMTEDPGLNDITDQVEDTELTKNVSFSIDEIPDQSTFTTGIKKNYKILRII